MQKNIFQTFDSLSDITSENVSRFKDCGFCYVKVNDKAEEAFNTISKTGRDFFGLPKDKKQQYPLKLTSKGYEGYVSYLNDQGEGGVNLQTYVYCGKDLAETFSTEQAAMDFIMSWSAKNIAFPLIHEIFKQIGILDHYNSVVDSYSVMLSCAYYPYAGLSPVSTLGAHRDTNLITVLFVDDVGLEVCLDGEWYKVPPKKGYAVVNIGKSLEVMTGKDCVADRHRVIPSAERDRLSVAIFVGPDINRPLINYKTGKKMYTDFKEFSKAQKKVALEE